MADTQQVSDIQSQAKSFVDAGWDFSGAISKAEYGLCNDGSCFRCRLTRILAETEQKFHLNEK